MKPTQSWLVVLVLAFAMAAPAAADDGGKNARIRKLIELTNSAMMGKQVMDALFAQFKPAFPQVPADVWDEMAAVFKPEELTELSIPIYERNFTRAEIDGLIAFYESPIGQTMLQKMPLVVQESLQAGNQWGQEKAREMIQKLKAKGFEPVEA